jgi:hypothetical protein
LREGVKQDSKEQVKKHPVAYEDAGYEVNSNYSLRGGSRECIEHDLVPILGGQQDERSNEGTHEGIKVVLNGANNIGVSECTTKYLHTQQGIDENEEHKKHCQINET